MYITHFHPKRQKSILYFILNAKSILSISSQTSMYALCHPKRLKYTPHFHPKRPKYNPNFYPKRQKFIPYFHPKLAKNIFPMHCIEQSRLIPGQRVVLQQRKRFPSNIATFQILLLVQWENFIKYFFSVRHHLYQFYQLPVI